MKSVPVVLLILLLSNQLYSQNTESSALSGKVISVVFLYPFLSDIEIKQIKEDIGSDPFAYPFKYPLLIINNIVIRDEKQINYFRNNREKFKIAKIKFYDYKRAIRKFDYLNIPNDGLLFVYTKKGVIIDP